MRSYDFLNLYKMLEEALEARYGRQHRRYSSVVMEFVNSPEGEAWREKVDMCREIRNLLTHTADVAGEPVVMPAQGVMDVLREVIEYVQRPPMALDYATPTERILKTRSEERVLPLMRAMSKKGFSHVPVIGEQGHMTGVFSVSTVFSGIMLGGAPVHEETRVRDFAQLLPVEQHMTEQFAFVNERMTLPEARAAFDLGPERRKRMAALFITRGGSPRGALLGMLTPWDVLRENDGQ